MNHLISNKDLVHSFESCSSNSERMKLLCHHLGQEPGFDQSLKEICHAPVKDLHRSLEAKTSGVKDFGAKRLFPALLKTNDSLSVAPEGCDFLPQLYGNRSAILFDLGKYEDCLINIDLTLAQSMPELLKVKLLFRRAKCLKRLNEPQATQSYDECMKRIESILNSQENGIGMDLKQVENVKKKFQESWKDLANNNCSKGQILPTTDQNCDQSFPSNEECGSLFGLPKRNEQFPVASSQISLSTSEQFGRGVFAEEDITPGQIVVLEEATVSLLCPEEQFRLNHCHHCLKRIPALLIPCDACDVLFCNDKCKKLSYHSKHQSVCQMFAKIKRITLFGIVEKLALRFVLKETEHGAAIDELCAKLSDVTSHAEHYSSLAYQLETNEGTRDSVDMLARIFKATILCQILRTQNFFLECSSTELDATIFKFGSLLVHFFQVVACNAHDINGFFSSPQCPSGEQVQIGSGLYPFCSMFNHSCDPNVVRHSLNGSRVVVTALKAIRKGDQLFDNYGCHYATMEKTQRQSYLWEQYRFRCACQACQGNFQLFQLNQEEPITFVDDVIVTEAIRDEIHHSMQGFNDLLAEMCNAESYPVKVWLGKLSAVKRHMGFINRYVTQPHREFEKGQETYKRILCYLTNCFFLEDGEIIPD